MNFTKILWTQDNTEFLEDSEFFKSYSNKCNFFFRIPYVNGILFVVGIVHCWYIYNDIWPIEEVPFNPEGFCNLNDQKIKGKSYQKCQVKGVSNKKIWDPGHCKKSILVQQNSRTSHAWKSPILSFQTQILTLDPLNLWI